MPEPDGAGARPQRTPQRVDRPTVQPTSENNGAWHRIWDYRLWLVVETDRREGHLTRRLPGCNHRLGLPAELALVGGGEIHSAASGPEGTKRRNRHRRALDGGIVHRGHARHGVALMSGALADVRHVPHAHGAGVFATLRGRDQIRLVAWNR
ncbi:MAG: hypothetical protein WCI09_10265 [Planctomycetota bacterium]